MRIGIFGIGIAHIAEMIVSALWPGDCCIPNGNLKDGDDVLHSERGKEGSYVYAERHRVRWCILLACSDRTCPVPLSKILYLV